MHKALCWQKHMKVRKKSPSLQLRTQKICEKKKHDALTHTSSIMSCIITEQSLLASNWP